MLSLYLDPLYVVICEGFTCIADLCFHDNITSSNFDYLSLGTVMKMKNN